MPLSFSFHLLKKAARNMRKCCIQKPRHSSDTKGAWRLFFKFSAADLQSARFGEQKSSRLKTSLSPGVHAPTSLPAFCAAAKKDVFNICKFVKIPFE